MSLVAATAHGVGAILRRLGWAPTRPRSGSGPRRRVYRPVDPVPLTKEAKT